MNSAPFWLHLPCSTSGTTPALVPPSSKDSQPSAIAHCDVSACKSPLFQNPHRTSCYHRPYQPRFQYLTIPVETLNKERMKGKFQSRSRKDQLAMLSDPF